MRVAAPQQPRTSFRSFRPPVIPLPAVPVKSGMIGRVGRVGRVGRPRVAQSWSGGYFVLVSSAYLNSNGRQSRPCRPSAGRCCSAGFSRTARPCRLNSRGGRSTDAPVTVTPLTSFAFAVKVEGLQLRTDPDSAMALLRDLFEKHSVLVFKSACLTDDELINFARAFAGQFPGAELEASEGPAGGRTQGASSSRLIGRIANFNLETGCILHSDSGLMKLRAGNGLWHIDSSFKVTPALASFMLGNVVVPPGSGGETEFASSRAAFGALDAAEQAELSRLICVHDFRYSLGLTGCSARFLRRLPPARHFLVRETPAGRSLFAGRHCSHIEGMPLQSGRALIRKINKHVAQEQAAMEKPSDQATDFFGQGCGRSERSCCWASGLRASLAGHEVAARPRRPGCRSAQRGRGSRHASSCGLGGA
ncbi:tfdA [Symbiodinium natans]|uniref:TfdA protein n=1 Tax=Symbiodinium natans TaxID=878477 RepID=A0A812PJW6_9DINO|nr:tfdA [Symbiodinium natans]